MSDTCVPVEFKGRFHFLLLDLIMLKQHMNRGGGGGGGGGGVYQHVRTYMLIHYCEELAVYTWPELYVSLPRCLSVSRFLVPLKFKK